MFCFFFKQKTAYEMRISDWSSDVCSSDLLIEGRILLRDIIDLDATYGGGPSEDAMNQAVEAIAEMEDEPAAKEEPKGAAKGKDGKESKATAAKVKEEHKPVKGTAAEAGRSEERRAGKEGGRRWRTRGSPCK